MRKHGDYLRCCSLGIILSFLFCHIAIAQQPKTYKLGVGASIFLNLSDATHYLDLVFDSPKGDDTSTNYLKSLIDRKMAYQAPALSVNIVDRETYRYIKIIKVRDASEGGHGILGWTYESSLEKPKSEKTKKKN